MARLFDDAQSQYLDVTGTPVSVEPMTLAAWFNTDDDTITMGLISLIGPSGHYANIQVDGLNQVRVYCRLSNGSVWPEAKTTTVFTTGTWHHACAVFTSSTLRAIYLDAGGKDTDETDCSVSVTTDTNIATTDGAPGSKFSGSIAEAAIWNAAISEEEVTALAVGYSPLLVRPQNLVAYWPLIRDTDQDWVGGYDLTPYNSPTVADHCPKIIYPTPAMFYPPTAAAAVTLAERGVMRGVMRGVGRGVH